MRRAIAPPHALHISQQLSKKRMAKKRERIADQQQLAPGAGHAHVHAADVRQKVDLALGVPARQGVGNGVTLLALKRIDGECETSRLTAHNVYIQCTYDPV